MDMDLFYINYRFIEITQVRYLVFACEMVIKMDRVLSITKTTQMQTSVPTRIICICIYNLFHYCC